MRAILILQKMTPRAGSRVALALAACAVVVACGTSASAGDRCRVSSDDSAVYALHVVDSAVVAVEDSPVVAAVERRCTSLAFNSEANVARLRITWNLNVSRLGGLYGP